MQVELNSWVLPTAASEEQNPAKGQKRLSTFGLWLEAEQGTGELVPCVPISAFVKQGTAGGWGWQQYTHDHQGWADRLKEGIQGYTQEGEGEEYVKYSGKYRKRRKQLSAKNTAKCAIQHWIKRRGHIGSLSR